MYSSGRTAPLGIGHMEAKLPAEAEDTIGRYVIPAVHSWRVFHFHDTSALAPVRNAQSVRDNLRFKPDASNLAPFLRMLRERHPKNYTSIVETVRMVAPFFKDFLHRADPGERIELEWLEEEDPDTSSVVDAFGVRGCGTMESMPGQLSGPVTQESVVNAIMDSFRRIVHALRSSHRAAGDLDLTGAQLFVLAALGSAGGTVGVKDLADKTRTDPSTVSVVVGRLVNRGLVKRVRSASDTRRVELSLTARGRAALRKTPTTVAQSKLAEALGRLSKADAATLKRTLKHIVEMMGEADAPAPMLFDDADTESAEGGHGALRNQRATSKNARTRSVRK